jgi:hypothetical protein
MEFLKELLGDELYSQVEAKLKGNDKIKLANLATGEYVGKDKFLAADSRMKDAEAQLKERDKQLDELKKAAGDSSALKEQIAKLQADNSKVAAETEAKIKQLTIDHAIDTAILKAKGRNAKAIKALIDAEKIKLDGEAVAGIDEQVEAIKKSDAYLFDTGDGPHTAPGGNPPSGGHNERADLEQAHADAVKSGNTALAIALKNKIFSMNKT